MESSSQSDDSDEETKKRRKKIMSLRSEEYAAREKSDIPQRRMKTMREAKVNNGKETNKKPPEVILETQSKLEDGSEKEIARQDSADSITSKKMKRRHSAEADSKRSQSIFGE